jgi:hypothetical protein
VNETEKREERCVESADDPDNPQGEAMLDPFYRLFEFDLCRREVSLRDKIRQTCLVSASACASAVFRSRPDASWALV